ncbi:oligosaccharide biosynthesis protein Alg14 like-domain-containing protein [Xylariomycetidae sp. FL0641]|nr:oligosaccharide biosynthesis protein Alg14 like-domain-containing protein [Xylariomycetidae sp. FL0641]KAI0018249.1 oligosaccharide biosynthesis protein Alg14 like-domain-containing protein [Xylariomycetidae sp. FL0641]
MRADEPQAEGVPGEPQDATPRTSEKIFFMEAERPGRSSSSPTLPVPSTRTQLNHAHQFCLEEMQSNRYQAVQTAMRGALPDLTPFALAMSGALLTIAAVTITIDRTTEGHFRGAIITSTLCLSLAILFLLVRRSRGTTSSDASHYVLLICGSGGHTAEMIRMIERSIRPEKAAHRRWAVGRGDTMSYDKVLSFERQLARRFSARKLDCGTFDIVMFDRARLVHQSWLTTPFTAVLSIAGLFRIVATRPRCRPSPNFHFPGVIVTNGPGTGFLFLLAARILRLLHIVPQGFMKTIFVESWARIKTLSLSGRLIHRLKLADLFIVQSRPLAKHYGVYAENLPGMPVHMEIPLEPEE